MYFPVSEQEYLKAADKVQSAYKDANKRRDDKLELIMNVIPGEEPSSGPNYYSFDPNVLYAPPCR